MRNLLMFVVLVCSIIADTSAEPRSAIIGGLRSPAQ